MAGPKGVEKTTVVIIFTVVAIAVAAIVLGPGLVSTFFSPGKPGQVTLSGIDTTYCQNHCSACASIGVKECSVDSKKCGADGQDGILNEAECKKLGVAAPPPPCTSDAQCTGGAKCYVKGSTPLTACPSPLPAGKTCECATPPAVIALSLSGSELYLDTPGNCHLLFNVAKTGTAISGAEIYRTDLTTPFTKTTDASGQAEILQSYTGSKSFKAKNPATNEESNTISIDLTQCGCAFDADCSGTTPYCCTDPNHPACGGKRNFCVAKFCRSISFDFDSKPALTGSTTSTATITTASGCTGTVGLKQVSSATSCADQIGAYQTCGSGGSCTISRSIEANKYYCAWLDADSSGTYSATEMSAIKSTYSCPTTSCPSGSQCVSGWCTSSQLATATSTTDVNIQSQVCTTDSEGKVTC